MGDLTLATLCLFLQTSVAVIAPSGQILSDGGITHAVAKHHGGERGHLLLHAEHYGAMRCHDQRLKRSGSACACGADRCILLARQATSCSNSPKVELQQVQPAIQPCRYDAPKRPIAPQRVRVEAQQSNLERPQNPNTGTPSELWHVVGRNGKPKKTSPDKRDNDIASHAANASSV